MKRTSLFAGILCALCLLAMTVRADEPPKSEPVQFAIQIESTTDVTVTINDTILKPGNLYESEALPGPVEVTF